MGWVYLQNCHLFVSWLINLEVLCDGLTPEKTHRDFRLWLTSMPCAQFPVSILQNGVKMTNEPPKGLKANLKATYYKMTDVDLQSTDKPEAYRKLLFALCFFHACCQERRKFGPLGWNVPYEFNETDLDISRDQLQLFLDAYDEIPYRVLCFLTSYINYGGRVTDYIDIRTCDVIMKSFYRPQIFETDYPFEPSGTYRSIDPDPESPHQSYMDYIETLPLTAGPAIFGMHDNANISCAFTEAMGMFDTLLTMEASGGGGGGGGSEELIAYEVSQITEKLSQAFLTGSMQNYARSKQFPIDTIAFDFIMLDTFSADSITTKPTDGVYIRGLFLEGARWDPEIRSLNDSRPKQLFSPAPIMHLSPCKDREEPTGGIYRCPIYKVLSRRGILSTTGHSTNFVMWIEIPSNREDGINNDGKVDQLEWAKGGVAAFCSLKF